MTGDAIGAHSGLVFKILGDACCPVLPAPDVAGSGSRHPASEDSKEISIVIRMGLYTGGAEERDGDYCGATVNCVARVAARCPLPACSEIPPVIRSPDRRDRAAAGLI